MTTSMWSARGCGSARWALFAFVVWIAGCSSDAPRPVSPSMPEALLRVEGEVTPYLNVSIAAFTSGEATNVRASRIYAPIRLVESNYLPVTLRNTLMDSGYWGAVKVAPEADVSAELQVTAEVLRSTAIELELHVRVTDSRGLVWIDKHYHALADSSAYDGDEEARANPFQALYNRVANDMSRARQNLTERDATTIVRASLLRYAVALSPETFQPYLAEDSEGILEVIGLPAAEDRMYERVKKIRDAEYLFTDAMDDQFNAFYEKLQNVYPYWQRYSFELLAYNDRIRSSGSVSGNKKRAGSWEATEDVYRTYKEFKLNEDELRELADSFRSETEPTLTEFEGRVIRLGGPLQEQYNEWRKLLRMLYAEERGTP